MKKNSVLTLLGFSDAFDSKLTLRSFTIFVGNMLLLEIETGEMRCWRLLEAAIRNSVLEWFSFCSFEDIDRVIASRQSVMHIVRLLISFVVK